MKFLVKFFALQVVVAVATPALNRELNSVCLYQDDFAHGTYIIRTPGHYKLCEDVSFCPNEPVKAGKDDYEDAFDPVFSSTIYYDENAYALGFFAAISIVANDTIVDLNGYTLEQCPGHALMQRFFALIELAAQPFIKGVGPHSFVGPTDSFETCNNVVIQGPGVLGLSSHHGIHGNQNMNVTIRDITFEKFEVAAVSVNNIDGLLIENCIVNGNRKDVPVVGLFSATRFIRPFMKFLTEKHYHMKLRNKPVRASVLYDRILLAIRNVYDDVMENGIINQITHPEEYRLFNNPHRVIDGPCYAFLVHGRGPAINGFGSTFPGFRNLTSARAVIRNNVIRDLTCFNNEIPAAVENGKVVNDVRGSVLQFFRTLRNEDIAINSTDGTYLGDLLSDAQIMVAKAIAAGKFPSDDPLLLTATNTIPGTIITWAEGVPVGKPRRVPTYKPLYRCDGDSMHHVAKGIVVIRVEETMGFSIENNTIDNVINLSSPPFTNCNDYHVLADPENANKTQIGNVRGISVAATRAFEDGTLSSVLNNKITNCDSVHGNFVVGIDVQGDTEGLLIKGNIIHLKQKAAYTPTDKYVALIVGENADAGGTKSTIVVRGNKFRHEKLIQNERSVLRRGLQEQQELKERIGEWQIRPHGHRMLNEIDLQNMGGCPFA